MAEIIAKNRHLLVELARASLAMRHTTHRAEREGLENLVIYLVLELEKRARMNHYYEAEKPKHPHFWQRAALQFRIGRRVSQELQDAREAPDFLKDRVDFWLNKALSFHLRGTVPATA